MNKKTGRNIRQGDGSASLNTFCKATAYGRDGRECLPLSPYRASFAARSGETRSLPEGSAGLRPSFWHLSVVARFYHLIQHKTIFEMRKGKPYRI